MANNLRERLRDFRNKAAEPTQMEKLQADLLAESTMVTVLAVAIAYGLALS